MEKEINFEQELYKAFGQVKDFTLGMRIAKWFYDMGKNSQEPVSEELEEAADNCYFHNHAYARESFIEGANWQKEQFENNRLKHCNSITNEQAELEQGFIDQHLDKYNRMPTFLDAIEYGMNLQKEQMMAKAVDGEVTYGKSLAIPSLGYFLDKNGLDFGDKVKLVIIKED